MRAEVTIPRRGFIWAQYGLPTTLLLVSLLLYVYESFHGVNTIVRFCRVFDVSPEDSVPTWFSSVNLLFAAVLLFSIHLARRPQAETGRPYWLFLGLVFLALSIDEIAGFHERSQRLWELWFLVLPESVTSPEALESNRWLLENWVAFGLLFAILVFLALIPFLKRLPRRTMVRFLIAGAIFVSGAVGFEALGSWLRFGDVIPTDGLLDGIRRLCEEGGELYGVALFNCTLFDELTGGKPSLTLIFRSGD